jgi:hypothetical protein
MEQQEVVVACARAAVRWLKKPPEHHHADRHRKAWAAAKTLSVFEQSCVSVSRAGFSLRRGADAPVIPLARITRWGHDASDFFVEVAAADAPITSRTDGVIRIVVGTRDGARLASVLRNHAIRALRAIDAAAAAARPRVNRRRSAVDEALIAAGSPMKPSPLKTSAGEAPRDDNSRAATVIQARWRGARLRLTWRREESALVLQCFWRGCATRGLQVRTSQLTRRE